MKILVSAVRMPFALAVVRGLGEAGHDVVATDSVHWAPGMHSNRVSAHVITVPPRDDPVRYAEQLLNIYREHGIELHVPTFEALDDVSPHHLDSLQEQGRALVEAEDERIDALCAALTE